MASLGHTGRRRVVFSHTLNTQALTKTDEQKTVRSKFTILCCAAFIAILGHVQPVGCGLDTPARITVGLGKMLNLKQWAEAACLFQVTLRLFAHCIIYTMFLNLCFTHIHRCSKNSNQIIKQDRKNKRTKTELQKLEMGLRTKQRRQALSKRAAR